MSSEDAVPSEVALTDRRQRNERRHGQNDRRQKNIPVAVERRSGKDRRIVGERRRQVDPTTCEKDYSDEEIIFMKAMDQYKRDNRRPSHHPRPHRTPPPISVRGLAEAGPSAAAPS